MRSTDRNRRIEQRAHEIWEAEGRPHGKHDEHWHRAVREIAEQEGGGRGGRRASSGGKSTAAGKTAAAGARPKADAGAKKAGGATKRTAKPAASAAAGSGAGRGRRKQPSAG